MTIDIPARIWYNIDTVKELIRMTKYIPFEKMSKRAKREYLNAHRKPAIPTNKVDNSVFKYKKAKRSPVVD